MTNKTKSFSFVKSMARKNVTTIAIVLICFLALSVVLIHPVAAKKVDKVSTKTDAMDISGVWLTPFENVSYKITQKGDQYTWTVRETGETGKGIIKGNKIVSNVGDKKAVYKAVKFDSNGNPVVLFSKQQNYLIVTLFRTCDDFKVFMDDLGKDRPHKRLIIHSAMKSLSNTPCPTIIQSLKKNKK